MKPVRLDAVSHRRGLVELAERDAWRPWRSIAARLLRHFYLSSER